MGTRRMHSAGPPGAEATRLLEQSPINRARYLTGLAVSALLRGLGSPSLVASAPGDAMSRLWHAILCSVQVVGKRLSIACTRWGSGPIASNNPALVAVCQMDHAARPPVRREVALPLNACYRPC